MNKFIGIGHLGGDPEPLNNGCKFSIATEVFDGSTKKTIWIKVLAFGQSGINSYNHLSKGRRVLVEGRLDTTHTGGTCIISDDITFL